MITFCLLKRHFAPIFITLVTTLQISACSTGDFLTAVSPDIGSGTTTEISDASNRSAVISGVDIGSVIEDVDPDGNGLLEVTGKLNIIDNDDGEAAFIITTFKGSYGELTINAAGNWTYAANNNQAVIQNLVSNVTLTITLLSAVWTVPQKL